MTHSSPPEPSFGSSFPAQDFAEAVARVAALQTLDDDPARNPVCATRLFDQRLYSLPHHGLRNRMTQAEVAERLGVSKRYSTQAMPTMNKWEDSSEEPHPMQVSDARAAAHRWIHQAAPQLPGLVGAFLAGSTNWLADDALLPIGTDVDVMVVLDGDTPPPKLGKFIYEGTLLEATYLASDQLRTAEHVLGHYHLAPSLYSAHVIFDPTGRLIALQSDVARSYSQRAWVRRRCEQAHDKIRRQLQNLEAAPTWPDQVITWLFSTGVMTHVLLVAGLRNPTVRRRYVAVRDLLDAYGQGDYYPTLLRLLGCGEMRRTQAEKHLAALTQVFDVTEETGKETGKSRFFFSSDLSENARPIAIDGSRALIEQGDHREAVFWMLATYSRCEIVLLHDAPAAMQARFAPGYAALLDDLGIQTLADLQARRAQVLAELPTLWRIAEEIMEENPAITG